jgi:hypothetical protein
MSYKVITEENTYSIFEKESDITIDLRTDEKKARDLCRKLNLGSGFNGWTPPFFAVKYPLTIS